jgi:hypothetical protein
MSSSRRQTFDEQREGPEFPPRHGDFITDDAGEDFVNRLAEKNYDDV